MTSFRETLAEWWSPTTFTSRRPIPWATPKGFSLPSRDRPFSDVEPFVENGDNGVDSWHSGPIPSTKIKRTARQSSGHAIGARGGLEHRRWSATVEALGLQGSTERAKERGGGEDRERVGGRHGILSPPGGNGGGEHLLAGIDDGHSATELLSSAGGRWPGG
jgi:hypothetical protein